MCEPCKQDCLAKTTEAWAQAADERDRKQQRIEFLELQVESFRKKVNETLFHLGRLEYHCPCGHRPESPETHPHVSVCLVYEAIRRLKEPLFPETRKDLS